jgi:hypothetical protein
MIDLSRWLDIYRKILNGTYRSNYDYSDYTSDAFKKSPEYYMTSGSCSNNRAINT